MEPYCVIKVIKMFRSTENAVAGNTSHWLWAGPMLPTGCMSPVLNLGLSLVGQVDFSLLARPLQICIHPCLSLPWRPPCSLLPCKLSSLRALAGLHLVDWCVVLARRHSLSIRYPLRQCPHSLSD